MQYQIVWWQSVVVISDRIEVLLDEMPKDVDLLNAERFR